MLNKRRGHKTCPLSNSLIENLKVLHYLSKTDPETRQLLVSTSQPRLIAAIIEIALNLLCGNIRCSSRQRKQLKKYKKQLRELAFTSVLDRSCKKEKKIINQKGGSLLSLLIPPALSAISSLILPK